MTNLAGRHAINEPLDDIDCHKVARRVKRDASMTELGLVLDLDVVEDDIAWIMESLDVEGTEMECTTYLWQCHRIQLAGTGSPNHVWLRRSILN